MAAWTHGFAGVAALTLATGRLHAISPFPDPAADQADGAAAGRWLVWTQTSSVTDLDSFTVDAWDADDRADARARPLADRARR